ncbi:basic blue protein [Brachypodium distachyon]|uniref:Plantacyanin n=1 Tax=Brachypodium distachyon TaxID=15368 RepID=I1GZ52_BRADI|nr:basic blue protein [Brachypodium distachyon]KQK18650.1 hypothetical protein BRADI_1g43860v3 [Brachypodium distachyon]|eukprot:XP_003560827.1 basic blue protein [Brachypodium distachyon]
MAAQGRGSASTTASALVAGAVLLCLLLPTAMAKTYMVGDGAGWTKNLESTWLPGKTFYAGDVFVFKYDKEKHDVTVVGGKGYARCKAPRNSTHSWVMRTGNDQVTLRRGSNFFICGQPDHCAKNMKLAVKAL